LEQLGGPCLPTGSRQPLLGRPRLEALEARLVPASTRPAAIFYNNAVHVITTGNDGNLYDATSTDNAHWSFKPITNTWLFAGVNPTVTNYSGRLHVFVAGFNAHLYDVYTDDGVNWHTPDDHGAPIDPNSGSPADIRYDAGAISYWYGNTNYLHVFIEGKVGSVLHVYDHWWDGSWHWTDRTDQAHRGPFSGQTGGAPAAVTYWNGSVTQVHVYLTNDAGHLFDLFTNDNFASWKLDDHNNGGAALYGSPGVTTYEPAFTGTFNELHVLVASQDGRLWDHWWDGGTWHWKDRGAPGGFKSFASPAVTTYWDGSHEQLHAYVAGGPNGDLYDIYTNDDNTWHCDNHGKPNSSIFLWRAPAVVEDGANRLDVFAHGSDGSLYEHWWENGSWSWSSGLRPTTGSAYIVRQGGQPAAPPQGAGQPADGMPASPAAPPASLQPLAADGVFGASMSQLASSKTRWALLQAGVTLPDWSSIEDPLFEALQSS
jgi:hypothetical protein